MSAKQEFIVDIKSQEYDPGKDYIPAEGLKFTFNLRNREVINNLGFLCYSKRTVIKSSRGEYSVDTSSLDKSRYKLANELLHDLASVEKKAPTIQADFEVYQSVLNWFDNNGFFSFHRDREVASQAYKEYSAELRHLIKTSTIKPRTAGKKQRYARQLIVLAYEQKALASIIYGVIFLSESSNEPIEALDERLVKNHIAMLAKIFTIHGNATLNQTKLPYLFECDEFKSFVNASFNSQHIKTPYDSHLHQLINFDFNEGRVLTFDEYKDASSAKNPGLRDLIEAQRRIDDVNSNPRHKVRLVYCTLSMQAYLHMFIAATGANGQPLQDLEAPQLDEVKKDTLNKELREIKIRGNNRVVSYKITRRALQYFRKYLELREWHLNGKQFKYLFYTVDNSTFEIPQKLKDGFTSKFYKRIRGRYLPKDAEAIGSRKYRRFRKDVHEALGIDPMVTAEILGHSLGVSERDYSGGSRTRQKRELTKFWQNIDTVVKTQSQRLSKTPIGGCENIKKPEPVSENIPVKPNCNVIQSCLYCIHYALHSDEQDLLKLMSAKYFMEVVINDFPDFGHAEKVYRPLIERINEVIAEIKTLSSSHAELIDSIHQRVFGNHEITSYWQLKLDRFDRLGVIAL